MRRPCPRSSQASQQRRRHQFWRPSRNRIAAEERLDGKYLLTTSDPSLPAEDVALGYKQLLEAERSFRDLKGTLALRPVFHRKDERIRAHVLICFLALVIIRVAETRTGDTWRTTRAELATIRQGHFRSRDGEFTQTTELTNEQRDLHRALQIAEPPRFGGITPARPGPQPVGTRRTSRTKSTIPSPHAGSRPFRSPTTCGTPA